MALLILPARGESGSASGSAAKKSTAVSAKSSTHHKAVHKKKTSRKKSRRIASWRRGQQTIQPERAQEIQDALVRQHYLKTESGMWDSNTQAAMQRYQADHGWQTKTTPDARALISLGLGPDHDHLLNPESAMTSGPNKTSASTKADVSKTNPSAVAPASMPANLQPPAPATDAPSTDAPAIPASEQ
ncbi:MAG TPA: hypothetical protein VGG46_12975 [Terriglobales bacterium]